MARADSINKPRGGKLRGREFTAVGYVRRSTDRQEQSIPDQKHSIERYAEEQGLKLLRFYVDDAISGTSTVGRKAFQTLISDAKRSTCEFGQIIVYDVKRFGRVDNDEAGYYRHILKTHGVEILYVSENFTGDGTDDLLRPVKQWQAREESKDLSKVTIRGLVSKATNGTMSSESGDGGGWWMGGAPPYGYDLRYESRSGEFLLVLRYMRDGSKQVLDANWKPVRVLERGESLAVSRRDRCKLEPGEQRRIETVKLIFQMYVKERMGFKAIADALNRQDIPSPRGPEWASHYSGKWSLTTVRAILVNPAYSGDMVWNRRTDARFHRIIKGQAVERRGVVGRRLEPNDESDWIVVRNAHKAIVQRRTWERAQQLLKQQPSSKAQRGINPRTGQNVNDRAPNGGWTGPRAKFLLSGLISCSHCGSRYEGYTRYAKQRDEQGRRIKSFHYACGGYIRHGRTTCTLGAIDQEQFEAAVIEAILDAYAQFRGRGHRANSIIAAMIEQQVGADRKATTKQRRSLEARRKKIDTITRNLIDSLSPANRVQVDRRLAELETERQQVEGKLESLERMTLSEQEFKTLIRETIAFAKGLNSTLNGSDLDQRRASVRRCVQGIVIDRENDSAAITIRSLPTLTDGMGEALSIEVVVPLMRRRRCRSPKNAPTAASVARVATRHRGH
ncbi:MAG: recombinase family protein [Planctomycetes bacterium]|nr:recombinase family protein [Planctomycetota bacterium]